MRVKHPHTPTHLYTQTYIHTHTHTQNICGCTNISSTSLQRVIFEFLGFCLCSLCLVSRSTQPPTASPSKNNVTKQTNKQTYTTYTHNYIDTATHPLSQLLTLLSSSPSHLNAKQWQKQKASSQAIPFVCLSPALSLSLSLQHTLTLALYAMRTLAL